MFLLIAVLLFIIQAQKHDKIASWLFIPYAVWVGFATILNAAIYWLNEKCFHFGNYLGSGAWSERLPNNFL